jgi:hypothetical protein
MVGVVQELVREIHVVRTAWHETEWARRAQVAAEVHWGRSESIDLDDVGDIADEGAGHRG